MRQSYTDHGCVATLAAMRVLYLSYDGLTDGLGRSQVLPYILGLERKGHTFTVISFEKKERYAEGREAINGLLNGKAIVWEPLMYTASPPVVSTVYDLWQLQRLVARLHGQQPFDLIHCRSYITSLVGLRMKMRHGVPFIFDMRAFYADERVDGSLWNLDSTVYRSIYGFFKQKEKEFLQEADCTVSLTAKGRDIIHSWKELKGQPLPIEVIPCCADLTHFSEDTIDREKLDTLRSELGIHSDGPVLAYLGSVGTWYMLPEMLDFFKVLLSEKPRAKLLFITRDDPNDILGTASSKGIPHSSIFIRPATREEVPTYLSLADAALFFIRPVFSKSGSSPTKHGEVLGMGLPVIANAGVGDVDSIMNSTGTGLLVNDFTEEEYRNAVSQLDDLLNIPKERLRAAACEHYSLETGVERYHRIYTQVGRQ